MKLRFHIAKLYEKTNNPTFSPYASIGVICGSFISASGFEDNGIPAKQISRDEIYNQK